MARLALSADGRYLELDGHPFFYFADTCWSAFTNISSDEWQQYLDVRARQGFNHLQINILPQWDRSREGTSPSPFRPSGDGYDFARPDEAYFDHAEQMLSSAAACGLRPALVVLWTDYAAGNWGSRRSPGHVIPPDRIDGYVAYVARRFDKYEPIYIASGDTDFEEPSCEQTYLAVLESLARHAPLGLTALHVVGGFHELPAALVRSPHLDLYFYQSDHIRDSDPVGLSRAFLNKPVRRPVINSEPCYEGLGSPREAGRFGAADVRRASWLSLLSGASAGLAYGANGIWNWHHETAQAPLSGIYRAPAPWHDALRFPGADDVALAVQLFTALGMEASTPLSVQAGETAARHVAAAATADALLAYLGTAVEIELEVPQQVTTWRLLDLERRVFLKPRVGVAGGRASVGVAPVNGDALLIGTRK